MPEQRAGRARTPRPFRAERAGGQPQQQEQREGTGAAERRAAPAGVLAQAMLSASSHALAASLPVPKPCSNAIGQLA
jgi:hypothetical protein